MQLVGSDKLRVVVGLGKSGLSSARYLYRQGKPFIVVDSRRNPPGLAEMAAEMPEVRVHTGKFDAELFGNTSELVMSPGVALSEPAIAEAISQGCTVAGDIELFARDLQQRNVKAPVVAITGSNGKSTVTTLVGQMVQASGLKPAVGGNIGTPALELLDQDADVYVLELSSFQLETTTSLQPAVATVLNVSADHMDRYPSLLEYQQAKQQVYRGCRYAVCNAEDMLTLPLVPGSTTVTRFTLNTPDLNDFGLVHEDGTTWLARGLEKLLDTSKLKVRGRHNYANALAALAIGSAIKLPLDKMLQVLVDFTGLEHRCQWVAEENGITFFNDSKATNPGAAIAALEGLGAEIDGKVVLIAGGDGKGADFTPLTEPLSRYARQLILLGKDAEKISQVAPGQLSCDRAENMEQAVQLAHAVATSGDVVLLAPACASLDMYTNFEERGRAFSEAVGQVLNG
ncbi:UDP-N-acetylmuramoyl-L-alanine--D-glutamate ligase [Endozoicomonadaceae bacterium StTr2]